MSNLDQLFDLVSSHSETAYFKLLELLEGEDDVFDLDELNSARQGGKSLIAACAYSGYIDTFKYLIEKGLDIALDDPTLLYWAIQNPSQSIEQHLIDPNNHLHDRLADGTTPLHLAALQGDNLLVKILLETNPDYIGMVDKNGYTAVFYAAFKGFDSIIQLITAHAQYQYDDAQKNSFLRGKGIFHFRMVSGYYSEEIHLTEEISQYQKAFSYLKCIEHKDKHDYHFLCNALIELASVYTNLNMFDWAQHYSALFSEYYFAYSALHDHDVDNMPAQDQEIDFRQGNIQHVLKNRAFDSVNPLENQMLGDYLRLVEQGKLNAKQYGYECINVPSDGNCFFYAVEDQLRKRSDLFPDIDLSAQNLRTMAFAHIMSHQYAYENAFTNGEFDYFLTQANEKNYWANEHLICAMARVLNINIIILATHTDKPTVYKQKTALMTVYACNIQNIHFYSMHQNPQYKATASLDDLLAQEAVDDFVAIEEIACLGKRIRQYDPRFLGGSDSKKRTDTLDSTDDVSVNKRM